MDFQISEPMPFSSEWFSHKFKGPGLKYEVALALFSSRIIWHYGPFPCGSYPDMKIFRMTLEGKLDSDEVIIADKGYGGNKVIRPDSVSGTDSEFHQRARARHETVNKRLKLFHVLSYRFRHQVHLHSACFQAVVFLVNETIFDENPLFSL